MAGSKHAAHCAKCQGTYFREEKIVQLDSSVVVKKGLPVEARAIEVQYQYVCVNCNQVLDEPWTGHHE